jgi:DNA replication protein DnaC
VNITPSAVCDICGGSGWVTEAGSLDARACSCQAREKTKQRVLSASIPKRYFPHCTLAGFHDRGNLSLKVAKKRVTELVDAWPHVDRGLLLMGGCGSGKTHLAVAAMQEIIKSGKPGHLLFSNFQELVQEIQASFGDSGTSKSEILQPLLEADLLVLDELGSQKPTPFVFDILYYIINSRYNDEKVTVFTTNYLDEPKAKGEERLEDRIGERLRSRLYEMTDRVVIEAADYRKQPRALSF